MNNELNKQENRVNLNLAVIATAGYLLTANIAFANDADMELDINTPDEVILEDKNLDIMFKAPQPSATLKLEVEGLDNEILVTNAGDNTVLHVVDGDYEDAKLVKRVYSNITGKTDVETKLVFSEEFTEKK